ncbi:MAG: hypothetical protein ACKO96_40125 [Flammeovirgaceae bacterium]
MSKLFNSRFNNFPLAWITLAGYLWLTISSCTAQRQEVQKTDTQVTIQLAPSPVDARACRPSFSTDVFLDHAGNPNTKNFPGPQRAELAQFEVYEQPIITIHRELQNGGTAILLPHSFKVNLRI